MKTYTVVIGGYAWRGQAPSIAKAIHKAAAHYGLSLSDRLPVYWERKNAQ